LGTQGSNSGIFVGNPEQDCHYTFGAGGGLSRAKGLEK
jgi:hypothetical protein